MPSRNLAASPYFIVDQLSNDILLISPDKAGNFVENDYFDRLEKFIDLITSSLAMPTCKGVIYRTPIITSEMDYKQLFHAATTDPKFKDRLFALLSRFETLQRQQKPHVALIDGDCWSMQLACMLWSSHSIATAGIKMGFPESKYGLFPGFGATVLLGRALPTDQAIPLLTEGRPLTAAEAQALGLIDQLVIGKNEALEQAEKWIGKNPKVKTKGKLLVISEASNRSSNTELSNATNLTGSQHCLALVHASKELPLHEALALEVNAYHMVWTSLRVLQQLRTNYFGIQAASRIKFCPDYYLHKLGVLGAGMMGAGIAFEAARVGIQVVLKDVSLSQAQKGKAYAEQISQRLVQRGKMDETTRNNLLAHIQPTEELADLQNVDLIIEAVFEDRVLKAAVTKESFPYLNSTGFFASNTTSLPISKLATAIAKPEDFIGMHFFSPVDRMVLVEIICGKQTSSHTLLKALQVARQLDKIPIVVHDGSGFFTSRIFFNYLLEALSMLLEGISAEQIEKEANNAGFAVGPLTVLDEISLALMLHVYDQLPHLHASQQRAYNYLKKLVQHERGGRKSGKGFYDYAKDSGKKVALWQDPDLTLSAMATDAETIRKRLLHVVALDSYRCLDEGVLDRPIDGDIGSLLGIGYAPHTAGVFSHIDAVGLSTFVEECLAFNQFGEQWQVPDSLQKLAQQNFTFYTGFDSNWHPENP